MRFGDVESQGEVTPIPLPADFSISGQAQGDILYFNGTNWVRLAAGTADQSLRTKGAGANPAWENVNNATNLSISGETTGDVLYYNGANWVRLAAGTSGQLLQANGAAAPTWVDPPSSSTTQTFTWAYGDSSWTSGSSYYCPFNSGARFPSSIPGGLGINLPNAGNLTNFRVRMEGSITTTWSFYIYLNGINYMQLDKTNANESSWTTVAGPQAVTANSRLALYFNASSNSSLCISAAVDFTPS